MVRYEDEALIDYAWLTVEKLEFKILVMASVLAMNNRAFLGTIEDITNYLGIANNRSNKSKINEALSKLTRQGFIVRINDKSNIIIALSYDAKNNSKVIGIQRTWIDIIRKYNPSKKDDRVAWETILRVFIYLLGNCGKGIIKYNQIASDLSVSESTIKRAVKALCNIDFGNIAVDKERVLEKRVSNGKQFYQCLGTQFSIMINFEGLRLEDNNLDS